MGLLSPRKLYVTWEELSELQELGLKQSIGQISTDQYVQEVTEEMQSMFGRRKQ